MSLLSIDWATFAKYSLDQSSSLFSINLTFDEMIFRPIRRKNVPNLRFRRSTWRLTDVWGRIFDGVMNNPRSTLNVLHRIIIYIFSKLCSIPISCTILPRSSLVKEDEGSNLPNCHQIGLVSFMNCLYYFDHSGLQQLTTWADKSHHITFYTFLQPFTLSTHSSFTFDCFCCQLNKFYSLKT